MFEALTLIQTEKVRDFPVVLFGTEYWRELLDWIKTVLLGRGMISERDLQRLHVTDSPLRVVEIVTEIENSLSTSPAKIYDY
jgi:predicted Rossmann-fold nucleotide-binding protein